MGHNEPELKRATTVIQPHFDIDLAVQGKILWLPHKENLPDRAVRRAHGKGAIDKGIHNHPVVVISRPTEKDYVVHFHIITSMGDKRLDEVYNQSKDVHASHRSWFLPISPTPDHPDAISKKTKKRFPTLKLAHGELLYKDSYVNIRNVYKIDVRLLRDYYNPDMLDAKTFRFERESTIRMLAKCKSLTLYEPGLQYVSPSLKRSASEPTPEVKEQEEEHRHQEFSSVSEMLVKVAAMATVPAQPDFRMELSGNDRIAGPWPKVPPDGEMMLGFPLAYQLVEPLGRIFGEAHSAALLAQQQLVSLSRGMFDSGLKYGTVTSRCPPNQIWRDAKGVTAVIIASI